MTIKRIENVLDGTGVVREPEFLGMDLASGPGKTAWTEVSREWASDEVRELFELLQAKIRERRTPPTNISAMELHRFNIEADQAVQPMIKEATTLFIRYCLPTYRIIKRPS